MVTQLEIYDGQNIEKKLALVKRQLKGKRVIVAFSGGVDSSVMAILAKKYASQVLLVMQIGFSVGIGEKEIAIKQAEQLNLQLQFLEYDEVDYSQEYAKNSENRCYYCKNLLYRFLEQIKNEKGYDLIASGTNASDLNGHRPGHVAAIELGVVNPLAEAGLTKQEIRWIAQNEGLIVWNKPASACLASRIMTGVPVTKARLQRIAHAEDYIKNILGVRVLRVRDHGDLARIEVGKDELPQVLKSDKLAQVNTYLKSLGYSHVSVDLEGYRPNVPRGFEKE